MSRDFDLAVARTMAEQIGGERTRSLIVALCDEVERLRTEVEAERAAIVTWLRRQGGRSAWTLTDAIERGEHRREGAGSS